MTERSAEERLLNAILGIRQPKERPKKRIMAKYRGVEDGTPFAPKALCPRCRYSMQIRGAAESQRDTYCSELREHSGDGRVPFTVIECNTFVDMNKPSLYNMEKLAYVIVTDRLGKPIGFQPTHEVKKKLGLKPFDRLIDEPDWAKD